MNSSRSRSRGISLVEAMVALAVMAFGSLAVLGVQSTLRLNSDLSKQRSEAVRIAQETVETWRSFTTVEAFDALESVADAPAVPGINADYNVVQTVVAHEEPRRKTLTVEVSWTDRSGALQTVRIGSTLGRVPAALAGSLSVPPDSSLVTDPASRNAAIPPDAVAQSDGTSVFTPPSGSGVAWVFNNVTGFITKVCTGDVCTAIDARLLSGRIKFASAAMPTPAESELPTGFKPPGSDVRIGVVDRPEGESGAQCFSNQGATAHVDYYCAVTVSGSGTWSGRSRITPDSTLGFDLATSADSVDASKYSVCRYTRYSLSEGTRVPSVRNEEHPRVYARVSGALTNQNFIVIRSGNGLVSFQCPDDDPLTNSVDGQTWLHQPPS